MNQKDAQKTQFAKLIIEGYTSKDAAQQVGISEQTAGRWRKDLPAIAYHRQRQALQKRLDAAFENPKTTPSDLTKLTDSAIKLEKCIAFAMKSSY